jgi:hypothetical protein
MRSAVHRETCAQTQIVSPRTQLCVSRQQMYANVYMRCLLNPNRIRQRHCGVSIATLCAEYGAAHAAAVVWPTH